MTDKEFEAFMERWIAKKKNKSCYTDECNSRVCVDECEHKGNLRMPFTVKSGSGHKAPVSKVQRPEPTPAPPHAPKCMCEGCLAVAEEKEDEFLDALNGKPQRMFTREEVMQFTMSVSVLGNRQAFEDKFDEWLKERKK